jgi:hypothetical protein
MKFFSRKVFRKQSYRGMRKKQENFNMNVREIYLRDMNWLRIMLDHKF